MNNVLRLTCAEMASEQPTLDVQPSVGDDDKQLDQMLDANIDVDKQINAADLMTEFDSELAHIDSKTIEDVFKGVLDHQQLASPTAGTHAL